ncbi:hypothetical protein OEIGOIKO_02990 [Streptomyces chrestomyceticus JCM 4735]|uniref:Uncharacterized protein n=1 Tax=Streptomyces chrestomyceticus JCM 4735 TaxID=1306181 RepID=A0A7U9KTT1_9ACTN|nr:hypothetical protein OEIGOIKO_02990 [Streptomyces chrestomyceticus JCM 4735]
MCVSAAFRASARVVEARKLVGEPVEYFRALAGDAEVLGIRMGVEG